MDNSFTGFNPSQAKQDIHYIQSLCYTASVRTRSLCDSVCDLSEIWASPKAVEFGNTFVPRLENLWKALLDDLDVIVRNTARAIDTVAAANGYNTSLRDDNLGYNSKGVSLSNPFKEELDGNVGMNVMQVNLKRTEIEKKFADAVHAVEAIENTNIALYDPNGEMKEAYKSMLTIFKTTMDELISDIKTALDGAIETETNNIKMAKENATTTLAA